MPMNYFEFLTTKMPQKFHGLFPLSVIRVTYSKNLCLLVVGGGGHLFEASGVEGNLQQLLTSWKQTKNESA